MLNLSQLQGYIAPFLIGGTIVTGIKILGNTGHPFAAVLGAAPIGLFTSYYILDNKKNVQYLKKYSAIAAVNILATFFILLSFYLLNRTAIDHKFKKVHVYGVAFVLWFLIGAFVVLVLMK